MNWWYSALVLGAIVTLSGVAVLADWCAVVFGISVGLTLLPQWPLAPNWFRKPDEADELAITMHAMSQIKGGRFVTLRALAIAMAWAILCELLLAVVFRVGGAYLPRLPDLIRPILCGAVILGMLASVAVDVYVQLRLRRLRELASRNVRESGSRPK